MLSTLSSEKLHSLQISFRISIAVILAIILSRYIQVGKDYWLLMTVAIVYASPTQGLAMRRAKDRVVGTLLGIIAAFLFCHLFLHYHYQWMYAIILFYLLIFYFGMIKDFYMVACFFITLAVLSFTALNSPASTYLVQLLTDRFFYTVLAVLLIIFCELLIFPRAGQVGDKIASAFHNVCELYPSLLRNILCHYKDDQMLSEETVLMIQNLLKGYDDLKTKYFSQFYELRYSKENNDLYQRFFNFFDRVSVITSRLLAITTHSHEPIKSTRIKTALLKIIDILDDAFQSMKSPTLITQKRAYERDITQVTESLKESEKNNLALLLLLTCCEEIAAEIDQESAIK